MTSRRERRRLIKAELLRKSQTGLTDQGIADRCGVSRPTVLRVKRELRSKFEVRDAISGRRPMTPGLADRRISQSDAEPSLKTLLEAYPDAAELTTAEMMRALSILVSTAPPATQVQAIKVLNVLKGEHAPQETKGPPRPLTRADRVSRTARILECVGESVAREALALTYPGAPETVGTGGTDGNA